MGILIRTNIWDIFEYPKKPSRLTSKVQFRSFELQGQTSLYFSLFRSFFLLFIIFILIVR
jgi:hypothetical protein